MHAPHSQVITMQTSPTHSAEQCDVGGERPQLPNNAMSEGNALSYGIMRCRRGTPSATAFSRVGSYHHMVLVQFSLRGRHICAGSPFPS